ncbi:MAG: PorV/PorQ family protein [Ignavibacteria bacterium]|nr:PorV/PorQ family protein [Ignavibacteria bacterium]
MKKVVFVVFLLMNVAVYADNTPFNFLRNIASARAAALGGSFASVIDDPSAVFYNPATLSTIESNNFSFSFTKHILDVNSGNLVYIHDFDNIGRLAGSASFTSYGSFDYYDSDGNKLPGSFSANDLMFGVSYTNTLDTNLYYGVTLKFAYLSLEKASTSAMAIDAGLIYLLPDGRSNLAFSILHAGTQLSTLEGRKENMPLDVRIGANHRLRGLPLLANINFHHLADKSKNFISKFRNFSLGGEIYLGRYLQLRVGYNNHIRSKIASTFDKGMTGFSGGLGIVLEDFNIDYGFSQYGDGANLHRLSVSTHL